MIPINNSDTAWLIVADFNQDNSIGYPDCLRDDILNPEVNVWVVESSNGEAHVGGTDGRVRVGTSFSSVGWDGSVGDNSFDGMIVGGCSRLCFGWFWLEHFWFISVH